MYKDIRNNYKQCCEKKYSHSSRSLVSHSLFYYSDAQKKKELSKHEYDQMQSFCYYSKLLLFRTNPNDVIVNVWAALAVHSISVITVGHKCVHILLLFSVLFLLVRHTATNDVQC